MRKVLICGMSGFIGRNIAETLSGRGYELYGTYFKSGPFEAPGIKMIKADLTDRKDVERAVKNMDIIIQAAATTSGAKEIVTKPYYHVTDNAVMNSLILRAAHEYKVSHLIFFSCTVMYQQSGAPVKESDFDESQEIHPKYFGVGWTKIYIEKMCEFYSRISQTRFTVIRHSNIYGPHDKFDLERSHVFGATVAKVMAAKKGERITVWGSGAEKRDLLYVSDLADFVKLAIAKKTQGFSIYNIGYGNAVSVKELVKKIICHSGKDIRIEYDLSKPTIKTSVFLDYSKAKEEFGWEPKVSLDEGIKKTIEWYKSNEATTYGAKRRKSYGRIYPDECVKILE